MNDRDLLELAAKAAGLRIVDRSHPVTLYVESEGCKGGARWNPIIDDGDAMRLAVKLDLFQEPAFTLYGLILASIGQDPYAAARRSIVLAAAEIGRQIHEGGAA